MSATGRLRESSTSAGRRLWAGAEARSHGRGGVSAVARATGMSATTIYKGLRELASGATLERGRVRRPGGGRKPLSGAMPLGSGS